MSIDCVPLWSLFLGTILCSLLCMEVGFRLGFWRRKSTVREPEAALGVMIAATLGLLAFLLAITFNIAASRFDDRRLCVLKEANAIGTAYLRADFLKQPARDQVKKLLREYVSLRLKVRQVPIQEILSQSTVLQKQLWSEATSGSLELSSSPSYALFITSLNEVIDMHEERVAVGIYARVPFIAWLCLFLVALLSMTGVGYVCGLGGARSITPSLILILTFSMVLYLVADLDRPVEGVITTSQKPLLDLNATLGPP